MPYILVVDDEETILGLITFNLVKEGFEVDTATSGQEALNKVAARPPDLLILDWMLPGQSGLDVCRQLRGSRETAGIPIIMLTARGEEVDKILGLEMGANDYVTKPFSPRELTARVKAHLRAKQPPLQQEGAVKGQTIRIGKLFLDKEKYAATKDQLNIDLTPKEFELFFLMASNPGKVFRRDEILQRVWDYDFPADTRTVDVHIRYLRQKVEDDPNDPKFFLTVRGVGYKFRGDM
jgi:two-component system, OmpR family, alkaline phosphatase synthesis response regulator PhoP